MDKVERFLLFETNNRLFDIVDRQGLRPWDAIRYYVLMNIIRTENVSDLTNKDSGEVSKILYTIKKIFFFIWYLLRHRKKEMFFLLCSRDKKNGVYYDKISDSVYDIADKKKCFTIETTDNYLQSTYKYGKDVCPSISNVFVRLSHKKFDFQYIYKLIKEEFPHATITVEEMNHYYNRFIGQYKFYSLLFSLTSLQKVYFVQNNIQKGLIAAANAKGITLYEFQHGQISRNHPAYSYPIHESISPDVVYHPDYLLTFGEFWSKNRHYPGTTNIVIGNATYAEKVDSPDINGNGKFLVISNNVEGPLLAKRIKEILKRNTNFFFFFKLHPNQFREYEHYKTIFAGEKRVEVVSNQQTINNLLSECEAILLNDSTVELEALRLGRKVFVLKEQCYEEMDFVFGEEGVFPCNDVDDFLNQYENHKEELLIPRNDLFVPFKETVAKHILMI